MIIQCAECQTRFRLADEKMKPGGVKVRCSKCKHIFTAMPPDPEPAAPSAPEPAPEPTPQAAAPGEETEEEEFDFGEFNMEPVPEAKRDETETPAAKEPSGLGEEPAGSGMPEFSFEEEEEREEEAGIEFSFDEPPQTANRTEEPEFSFDEDRGSEEEDAADFEFSFDEPSGSEDEEDPGESRFSFGEEQPEDENGEGLEFSFDEPSEAKQETAPKESGFSLESEPQSGGIEFSFDEEEEKPSEETGFEFEEPSGSPDFDFGDDDSKDQSGPVEFSFEEPGEEKAPYGFEEDESGGPDAFDFGGDEKSPADEEEISLAGTSSGDEGRGAGKARAESADGAMLDRPSPPSHTEKKTPLRDRHTVPVEHRPKKSPLGRLALLLFLLLLVLAGAAAYFYWQQGELDIRRFVEQFTGQTAPATVTGQIRLSGLEGSFLTNQEVGQIFVIRGEAINDYPEARSAIVVKGILYDSQGRPVLQQTVFSGNPLDDQALRTMPFARIEESMNNQFGDSLSNLNVAPGKAIPFTIVFKNLPSDLAEFTVEVADSKPGSDQ